MNPHHLSVLKLIKLCFSSRVFLQRDIVNSVVFMLLFVQVTVLKSSSALAQSALLTDDPEASGSQPLFSKSFPQNTAITQDDTQVKVTQDGVSAVVEEFRTEEVGISRVISYPMLNNLSLNNNLSWNLRFIETRTIVQPKIDNDKTVLVADGFSPLQSPYSSTRNEATDETNRPEASSSEVQRDKGANNTDTTRNLRDGATQDEVTPQEAASNQSVTAATKTNKATQDKMTQQQTGSEVQRDKGANNTDTTRNLRDGATQDEVTPQKATSNQNATAATKTNEATQDKMTQQQTASGQGINSTTVEKGATKHKAVQETPPNQVAIGTAINDSVSSYAMFYWIWWLLPVVLLGLGLGLLMRKRYSDAREEDDCEEADQPRVNAPDTSSFTNRIAQSSSDRVSTSTTNSTVVTVPQTVDEVSSSTVSRIIEESPSESLNQSGESSINLPDTTVNSIGNPILPIDEPSSLLNVDIHHAMGQDSSPTLNAAEASRLMPEITENNEASLVSVATNQAASQSNRVLASAIDQASIEVDQTLEPTTEVLPLTPEVTENNEASLISAATNQSNTTLERLVNQADMQVGYASELTTEILSLTPEATENNEINSASTTPSVTSNQADMQASHAPESATEASRLESEMTEVGEVVDAVFVERSTVDLPVISQEMTKADVVSKETSDEILSNSNEILSNTANSREGSNSQGLSLTLNEFTISSSSAATNQPDVQAQVLGSAESVEDISELEPEMIEVNVVGVGTPSTAGDGETSIFNTLGLVEGGLVASLTSTATNLNDGQVSTPANEQDGQIVTPANEGNSTRSTTQLNVDLTEETTFSHESTVTISNPATNQIEIPIDVPRESLTQAYATSTDNEFIPVEQSFSFTSASSNQTSASSDQDVQADRTITVEGIAQINEEPIADPTGSEIIAISESSNTTGVSIDQAQTNLQINRVIHVEETTKINQRTIATDSEVIAVSESPNLTSVGSNQTGALADPTGDEFIPIDESSSLASVNSNQDVQIDRAIDVEEAIEGETAAPIGNEDLPINQSPNLTSASINQTDIQVDCVNSVEEITQIANVLERAITAPTGDEFIPIDESSSLTSASSNQDVQVDRAANAEGITRKNEETIAAPIGNEVINISESLNITGVSIDQAQTNLQIDRAANVEEIAPTNEGAIATDNEIITVSESPNLTSASSNQTGALAALTDDEFIPVDESSSLTSASSNQDVQIDRAANVEETVKTDQGTIAADSEIITVSESPNLIRASSNQAEVQIDHAINVEETAQITKGEIAAPIGNENLPINESPNPTSVSIAQTDIQVDQAANERTLPLTVEVSEFAGVEEATLSVERIARSSTSETLNVSENESNLFAVNQKDISVSLSAETSNRDNLPNPINVSIAGLINQVIPDDEISADLPLASQPLTGVDRISGITSSGANIEGDSIFDISDSVKNELLISLTNVAVNLNDAQINYTVEDVTRSPVEAESDAVSKVIASNELTVTLSNPVVTQTEVIEVEQVTELMPADEFSSAYGTTNAVEVSASLSSASLDQNDIDVERTIDLAETSYSVVEIAIFDGASKTTPTIEPLVIPSATTINQIETSVNSIGASADQTNNQAALVDGSPADFPVPNREVNGINESAKTTPHTSRDGEQLMLLYLLGEGFAVDTPNSTADQTSLQAQYAIDLESATQITEVAEGMIAASTGDEGILINESSSLTNVSVPQTNVQVNQVNDVEEITEGVIATLTSEGVPVDKSPSFTSASSDQTNVKVDPVVKITEIIEGAIATDSEVITVNKSPDFTTTSSNQTNVKVDRDINIEEIHERALTTPAGSKAITVDQFNSNNVSSNQVNLGLTYTREPTVKTSRLETEINKVKIDLSSLIDNQTETFVKPPGADLGELVSQITFADKTPVISIDMSQEVAKVNKASLTVAGTPSKRMNALEEESIIGLANTTANQIVSNMPETTNEQADLQVAPTNGSNETSINTKESELNVTSGSIHSILDVIESTINNIYNFVVDAVGGIFSLISKAIGTTLQQQARYPKTCLVLGLSATAVSLYLILSSKIHLVSAESLIQNARVNSVQNTSGSNSGNNFVVTVSDGEGLCNNSDIIFPDLGTGKTAVHQRTYLTALAALSSGSRVDIYSYSGSACDRGGQISTREPETTTEPNVRRPEITTRLSRSAKTVDQNSSYTGQKSSVTEQNTNANSGSIKSAETEKQKVPSGRKNEPPKRNQYADFAEDPDSLLYANPDFERFPRELPFQRTPDADLQQPSIDRYGIPRRAVRQRSFSSETRNPDWRWNSKCD